MYLTGRNPSNFRIFTALNVHWDANEATNSSNFLPTETMTVTKLLQQNGYRTGHFGKWHLGSGTNGTMSSPPPSAYGIDESCTFNSNDLCKADGFTANSSASIVDLAIDFMRDTRAMPSLPPFYLNVWLHVSHNLLNPSQEQKDACIKNSARCPCDGLADNQTTCAHQDFWAAQQDADVHIGRLLRELGDLNLRESTLVAFTTDK